jgi:REP element-mobilizing transposase RayT
MEQLFHELFHYYNCELFEAVILNNHVHLIHSVDPEISSDILLKKIKLAVQTRYQREIDPNFFWDPGYYVFSIGGNTLKAERERLLQQTSLHKSLSLESELNKFRKEFHMDNTDELTDLDEHRYN